MVDGTYENLIYTTLTDGSGSSADIITTGGVTDYSPRTNYGKLEYSYDGTTGWVTVANDLNNQLNNTLDRYRFYAPAEGHDTVFWRWTPYQGYEITITIVDTVVDPETEEETEVQSTATTVVPDTTFLYEHTPSEGIYKLVTEAPDAVDLSVPVQPQPTESDEP